MALTNPIESVRSDLHKTQHQSGGADAIKLDDLAAPDDNTDLNATVSAHGLLPKLGGGTTNFLRADGTWAAPGAGSGVYWGKISSGTDVAITGATSATLNRMHVVSGTSADYTITISGLSPTAGDVLGFYVKDYAAASKQFKLDAGGTVKIAGRTRYLVLTHANVVLLMWDGTDWQPLVLNLDSPWVDGGVISILGSVSNPTKASVTLDKHFWRRTDGSYHGKINLVMSGAGAAGSGSYEVAPIIGAIAETTTSSTTHADLCGFACGGNGSIANGSSVGEIAAVPYTTGKIRFNVNAYGASSGLWGSSIYPLSGTVRANCEFTLRMTDW